MMYLTKITIIVHQKISLMNQVYIDSDKRKYISILYTHCSVLMWRSFIFLCPFCSLSTFSPPKPPFPAAFPWLLFLCRSGYLHEPHSLLLRLWLFLCSLYLLFQTSGVRSRCRDVRIVYLGYTRLATSLTVYMLMETITRPFDGSGGSVRFHFNGSEWNFWMSVSVFTLDRIQASDDKNPAYWVYLLRDWSKNSTAARNEREITLEAAKFYCEICGTYTNAQTHQSYLLWNYP